MISCDSLVDLVRVAVGVAVIIVVRVGVDVAQAERHFAQRRNALEAVERLADHLLRLARRHAGDRLLGQARRATVDETVGVAGKDAVLPVAVTQVDIGLALDRRAFDLLVLALEDLVGQLRLLTHLLVEALLGLRGLLGALRRLPAAHVLPAFALGGAFGLGLLLGELHVAVAGMGFGAAAAFDLGGLLTAAVALALVGLGRRRRSNCKRGHTGREEKIFHRDILLFGFNALRNGDVPRAIRWSGLSAAPG